MGGDTVGISTSAPKIPIAAVFRWGGLTFLRVEGRGGGHVPGPYLHNIMADEGHLVISIGSWYERISPVPTPSAERN